MSTETKITDGGPAFPLPCEAPECHSRFDAGYGGMSLRDFFAAKAMILAAQEDISVEAVCEVVGIDIDQYDWQTHWPMYVANRSYAMADAMLKAREEV